MRKSRYTRRYEQLLAVLRAARKRSGLTQTQVGRKFGCTLHSCRKSSQVKDVLTSSSWPICAAFTGSRSRQFCGKRESSRITRGQSSGLIEPSIWQMVSGHVSGRSDCRDPAVSDSSDLTAPAALGRKSQFGQPHGHESRVHLVAVLPSQAVVFQVDRTSAETMEPRLADLAVSIDAWSSRRLRRHLSGRRSGLSSGRSTRV